MTRSAINTAVIRATGRLGWLRGATGAVAGIALAAIFGQAVILALPAEPWLLAPVAASAVLVFALPASPLAQPWPVLGGNVISCFIGLLVHAVVPAPSIAGALAVGAAIAVMSLTRCLHPPGGACALVGALAPQGDWLLLLPLTANICGLLAAGWLWNNLSGHPWPHRVASPAAPAERGYTTEDLDAVLVEWDEILDVSREDLDLLFRAVERRIARRNGNAR